MTEEKQIETTEVDKKIVELINKKIQEFSKEVLEIVDKRTLGFGYTLNSFLDHLSIISWIQYIAHKCNVNKPNKNFDDRDYIVLPSGMKIVITVNIEEYKENEQHI